MVIDKFWKDKRVFVTGATGLVGGWLVEKLHNIGADVVVMVRDWVPMSKFLSSDLKNQTTIVQGDLIDYSKIERILAEYEIEVVIHLAAQTIVPIANKNPLSTFESNIRGTWNLLEACRQISSIKSIVVASSDKAYGDADTLPYKETLPLKALYPYDVSKACADMLCQSYAATFDLPVAITRCGNFFGGGDLNWSRIIPGTIRAVFRDEYPIIRSDGSLVRDYIYVEDAVDAYILLAQCLSSNKDDLKGEAFNFSNNTQKNVLELSEMIIKIMDSNLKPIIKGEDKGEIRMQYLDSTKAKEKLNWQAKYGLVTGLRKTVKWYQEFLNNV
jgi:CDP-glucose 4,6-dehydratase